MLNTLLSATTALMTAITPISYTIVEDTAHLPILNPNLAQRQTLKLRLENGLEALLISDPGADQSAASLRVDVGSWSDPLEFAGMAHFCEHMLFMGTKTYPSENEFSTMIADYAGTSNAFTAPNRTVYMFSADTNGFLPILDRFAHFFIDPLFNPSGVSREMHAVDQEFAKNIENDGWREYMIFKETGNQEHPNRLFSTGNSQTLGKIPTTALQTWHENNYGAEKMHLVLYSPLPMATLKEMAIQSFSTVPKAKRPPIDTSAPIFSSQQKKHITYVKPIKNKQNLSLSWELPKDLSLDPTKSADLLAYALRRGQKFSLYEKLKEDGLIDSMTTQVDDLGGPDHRCFEISLSLTDKGINSVDTVVLHCFEAIAAAQNTPIPAYLLQEKNTMAQLNYQYQERTEPFSYIQKLGDSLADETLSSFPRNTLLSTGYSANLVQRVAQLLIPDTAMIVLSASPELTQVQPDRKEKWLGAEYAIRPVPDKWLLTWAKAKSNPAIRIAEPNPFLPTNLALAPVANATPQIIADHDLGKAYYVRSAEFAIPDCNYHIHIFSPELNSQARSAVLASIYIDHLTDVLHPTLSAAKSAGLSCSFDYSKASLNLTLSGYSEKAPLLLQEIARQMPLDPPTQEQFDIYVARHEKGYFNAQKDLPARQAIELAGSILNQDKTTSKEKLLALKEITYEEFLEFHEKLFESTYMQALFAGNLTLKEAESAWLDLIHSLGRSPFPEEERSTTKILQLPNSGPYLVSEALTTLGNVAYLVIDQGDFSYAKRAAQEISSSAIHEAFFNELRTKQRTGYIAKSDDMELEEKLFQFFVVQSNSHTPEDLLFRFEQFIESFDAALSERIPQERFETLKASQISSLQNRFRNLATKTALWDSLCFDRNENFTFVEQRIQGLQNLSYEDFLTQSHSFFSRANRKRLAILMQGQTAAPFTYQPIRLPELGEIATYAPRLKLERSTP